MKKFAGTHLRYPDLTGKRQAEGGRRLRGETRESRPGAPLVTIVTVCFNSAKTIAQTFRSVRNQTYDNIDYVVVDGGSSDGTVDLLKAHEDMIDYYVSEPDQGLYYAMNKGIELAQGELILILNSDDWYARHAVADLVLARTYSGCDIVCSLAHHVDETNEPTDVMRAMPYDASSYLRMPLRHETMLIPARIYDRVGDYDTQFRIISDYDFTIRLFEAGCTVYEYPRALLFFRQSGVSHVDTDGVLRERRQILHKYFPTLTGPETELLIDRFTHTGAQLMDLAEQPGQDARLRAAIRCYVQDNARNGLLGRGRTQWRDHGAADLERVHAARHRDRPRISVILAVYDAEDTLRDCLDSILAQSLPDFELICVNDCSPDGSQAILDDYAARDERVRLMKNDRNIGLGATRNRGIAAARGAYIFHVDPDDTLPPQALETLYRTAEHYKSELVRGAYLRKQFHHGSEDYEPKVMLPLGHNRTVVNAKAADVPEIVQMPEGHWAYLYDAGLARRVPYPEDLKMGQDAIFLVSALAAAESITVIPDVVYNYLENPKSAMNVFNFQKYLDILEWRRRAFHMLKNAKLEKIGHRFLNVYAHLPWHDQFIRSFQDSPDETRVARLGQALRAAFAEADIAQMNPKAPAHRRDFLQRLLEDDTAAAAREIKAVNLDADAPRPRPKVSVILPVYNAEKTLRRSIESALGQSLREIELLCINDRSPDDSQAIIDEFARADSRVVPILNEKNIGHGASRNAGIAAARGQYIFHLDPDDTLPPGALEKIHALAERYGSDMTRGAYIHEQLLLGQSKTRKERKGLKEGAAHIVNTTLAKSPDYLKSTEGHWSYLYRADFAKQVKYPEDLKMGQDSIFIVNAVVRAQSISVTDALVYHYRANPNSAMNTFNFRKFMDALEWRIRAWGVLHEAGFREAGDHLLFRFWSPAFFQNLTGKLSQEEKRSFDQKLGRALDAAGYPGSGAAKLPQVRQYLETALKTLSAAEAPAPRPELRIATVSTQDHGGAGIGSMRRVRALRRHDVQAELHVLLQKSDEPFVKTIPVKAPTPKPETPEALRAAWSEAAVLRRRDHPGLKARELFSKTGALVDFRDMAPVFDRADIVHLHWVAGVFDYDHTEVLADKPVAWSLADMNAFTGGCHYSEGCENYRQECRDCPLLETGSTLAHEAWKRKRAAYAKIENLHVICPSQWLADCARDSSLFGDRPVHVIPNALPVDRYVPTNRLVARQKLGLPLGKKLVVFGAANLTNRRKGGDILAASMRHLRGMGKARNVEGLFFGASSLNLGIKAHNMGHVSDDEKMSLIYAAGDVFAFPSREDNAPLTVVESMLSGTPVVGFPVGNVPELVQHKETGYIARYADAEDFARGLAWALEDLDSPEALRRGLRAHLTARAHNDPETAVERHLALYRKMRAQT